VTVNLSLKDIYKELCEKCRRKILRVVWERTPEEAKQRFLSGFPSLRKAWEKLPDEDKAAAMFGLE